MQASPAVSLCPSFSAHSSATLADIASRVVDEFRNEPHPDWIELDPNPQPDHALVRTDIEEFEFAFVTAQPNCSPVSADQIFHNGRIKPVYPVAEIDCHGSNFNPQPKTTPSGRVSLRRLMMDDRDATTSFSSSAAPTKHCKRWKLRDNFVFLSPSGNKAAAEVKISGDVKTTKEGEKRMSFHAQKQDLMGILANVNGLGRNLRPF